MEQHQPVHRLGYVEPLPVETYVEPLPVETYVEPLPVEIYRLIRRYHNAFSQGPAASADMTCRCLQYSCLQAIIISFCIDTRYDDEDVFWIVPAQHPLACCATFTCSPRLRHPQPLRCALLTRFNDSPEDGEHEFDYLGGSNRRPRFGPAEPRESQSERAASSSVRLPVELLQRLPKYFFEYGFLRSLAITSRSMLLATRSREHWTDLDVSLDQPGLEFTGRLRYAIELLSQANKIIVNLRQLAMLISPLPASVRLCWDIVPMPPQPRLSNLYYGFRSMRPLMGCADFDVFLPANVRGIYVGVREWHGQRQSCCRVDNLFRQTITWSIGINDDPVMPHPSASRHAPVPDAVNRFSLRWDQRTFSIALNGVGVSRARLRDGLAVASPALSQVFFMAFGHGMQGQPPPACRTIPSSIQANASIRCGLCHREHSLLLPRWSVCPMCSTWICSSHIGRTPWASCPHCVMQLQDYLGGSSAFQGIRCSLFQSTQLILS